MKNPFTPKNRDAVIISGLNSDEALLIKEVLEKFCDARDHRLIRGINLTVVPANEKWMICNIEMEIPSFGGEAMEGMRRESFYAFYTRIANQFLKIAKALEANLAYLTNF